MNFTEALTRVGAADSLITELIVPAGRVTAESDGLHAAGQVIRYQGQPFEQFCGRFRHDTPVPTGYIRSLPPPMAAELIRLHLDAGLDGGDTLAVYSRGPDVIGIGDPNLTRLTGTEVLESVLDGVGGQPDELAIEMPVVEGETVRFDVITQRAAHVVRRGDVVSAGLSVRHSLIGEFATKVEGYLFRMLCQNGAVYRECLNGQQKRGGGHRTRRLSVHHPGARQQQRDQVRRLAKEVFGTLNGRVSNLNRLTTERADLDEMARNWLTRSRLSSARLLPLLRQAHALEGGEPTAYAVMNAFTRVATHQKDLPPNVRNILARMGGLLAFGHSRLCTQCWSLIAANN
jgi:hypothetical protein